ncbi:hypothetical protein HanPSC8_Chr05g0205531 [Helianthus annuus]|nr:hypothetical protein HanPSC8_Chr05g0205531 [Helianthus annuus]
MYYVMTLMLQVLMSSSESSGLSDEHDPMVIVSDDEVAPIPEIFTSDSDSDPDPDLMSDDKDLDDFQPFALLDFGDDVPLEDDVLALPLPIHDQLIIGHPDGEHIVEPVPIHAISLAAILAEDWPFIIDLDVDADEIPVFHVDHPVKDLGDGEVFDVAILEVTSPVVSVVDISSDSYLDSDTDSRESVTSSVLWAVGLEAYPADDDAMSAAPTTPSLASTPTDTPAHTPAHAISDGSSQPPIPIGPTSWVRRVRFASFFPHTHPTDEGEPSGHPHIPPHEMSPHYQPSRPFPPSPPHVMPSSDPYHPLHHS